MSMIIETEKIPWLIETFVLLCVPICVHIVTVALAARFLGIPVRKVSFGIGPTLWERGRLRLGWFPLGAYVKLKDSREEDLPDTELADAFDHAPAWKQIAIIVAGLGAVLLLTALVLGQEGFQAFVCGFRQIVLGAFSPFSDAQAYLHAGKIFSDSHSFGAYAGLLGSKLEALNLFPVSGMNGLHILLTLIRGNRPAQWEEHLPKLTILPMLMLFGSWLLAIGVFISRS